MQGANHVKKGDEIIEGIIVQTSGILQVNTSDQEITIKPGELYKVNKVQTKNISNLRMILRTMKSPFAKMLKRTI